MSTIHFGVQAILGPTHYEDLPFDYVSTVYGARHGTLLGETFRCRDDDGWEEWGEPPGGGPLHITFDTDDDWETIKADGVVPECRRRLEALLPGHLRLIDYAVVSDAVWSEAQVVVLPDGLGFYHPGHPGMTLTWTCPECGREEIPERYAECPTCDRPNPSVTWLCGAPTGNGAVCHRAPGHEGPHDDGPRAR